jgi:hypothetical protein
MSHKTTSNSLRLHNLQRALHAIGDRNLVTEMAEETGLDLELFPGLDNVFVESSPILNPLRGKLHRDSPFVHCRF